MNKQTCIREVADLNQINRCIETIQEVDSSIITLTNILKLAGNDVRLKILYLLHKETSLCPCDLSDILDMTVPAISQHLRKLKDGGLVAAERDGQTIFYSITEPYQKLLKPIFDQIKENHVLEVLAA
ncbi:MAG: metalloregulator ArsR/SmtB family transcription factor [Balneolaceae bacterium]|nr:metalloregulator ArsR/SmtB family transcription factor [Balneolaceae bacterium]